MTLNMTAALLKNTINLNRAEKGCIGLISSCRMSCMHASWSPSVSARKVREVPTRSSDDCIHLTERPEGSKAPVRRIAFVAWTEVERPFESIGLTLAMTSAKIA